MRTRGSTAWASRASRCDPARTRASHSSPRERARQPRLKPPTTLRKRLGAAAHDPAKAAGRCRTRPCKGFNPPTTLRKRRGAAAHDPAKDSTPRQ
eukprot:7387472-Prymnesium_polylepis.1